MKDFIRLRFCCKWETGGYLLASGSWIDKNLIHRDVHAIIGRHWEWQK